MLCLCLISFTCKTKPILGYDSIRGDDPMANRKSFYGTEHCDGRVESEKFQVGDPSKRNWNRAHLRN